MRVYGHGESDVGLHRSFNEDRFAVDNEAGIYVVADGMGGKEAGDVAASIATRSVMWALFRKRRQIAAVAAGDLHADHLEWLVRRAMQGAARQVADAARRRASGMRSTLTMLVVAGDVAAIGHVGDSRAYLCRDELPRLLTRDHTVAAEMVECGVLDAQRAKRHPYNHILTRAIGREGVELDTQLIALREGDRFVLCSDGVSNRVADDDALAALVAGDEPADVARGLVDHANERGGYDNATAIVVQVGYANDAARSVTGTASLKRMMPQARMSRMTW